jgi:hypothetical protein
MKNKRFLVLSMLTVLGLSAICLIFKPTILFAQSDETKGVAPVIVSLKPSAIVSEKMASADEQFSIVERTLDRIQQGRTVTAEDNSVLDEAGMAIADTLKDAFLEASRSTLDAAESKGLRGNADDLAYFESFETAHIKRADKIAARSLEIESGIRNGSILDNSKPTAGTTVAMVNYVKEDKSNECTVDTSSSASAKVLKPCIAPCVGKKWVECAQCILKNVPQGIQYYNNFVNCWNGCSGFWKWACRAVCLAKFVYWIY